MRERQVTIDQVPVESSEPDSTITFGQLRKVWAACNAHTLELQYSGPAGFDSMNRPYSVYESRTQIIFASGTNMPGYYMASDAEAIIKLNKLIPLIHSHYPTWKASLTKNKSKREIFWKSRSLCISNTAAKISELMQRTDLDEKEVFLAFRLGASARGDHGIFSVTCASQQAFTTLGKMDEKEEYLKSELLLTLTSPAVVSLHGESRICHNK